MSVTMPSIKLSRDELISALERRRKWAQQRDAKAVREHQKAEQRALTDFRAKCRAALKWDYEKAKDNYFRVGTDRGPSCPTSVEQQLDEALVPIKASKQTMYTISNDGPTRRVWWLLTADQAPRRDLCADGDR